MSARAHPLPHPIAVLERVRRSVQRSRLPIAALAWLVCLVSLPGTVLCVGNDGHLVLTAAGCRCDAKALECVAVGDDGVSSTGAAVHGCRDTSLGAPSVSSRTLSWTSPGVTASAVLTSSGCGETATRPHRTGPGTVPSELSRARRSTVLLL